MINTSQYRAAIGTFNQGGSGGLQQSDKWALLCSSAKFLLFCTFLSLITARFFLKKAATFALQAAHREDRSILFITLCFYIFRAVKLFAEISTLTAPFHDSFFKFCHWNCNSLNPRKTTGVVTTPLFLLLP